jgi:hypothetical protein
MKVNRDDRFRYPIAVVWLLVLFVAFNFLLFILSGRPLALGGYENRTVHGIWIILSILIAYLSIKLLSKRLQYVTFIFIFLLLVVFITQRERYAKSYQVQLAILKNCVEKTKANEGFRKGDLIIGNVPSFFPDNYNYELLFAQTWDWGMALNIYSKQYICAGLPFTAETIRENQIKIEGDSMTYNGWWRSDIKRMWYYEYDLKNGKSVLIKINNRDELYKLIFIDVLKKNINPFNKPFYEKIRLSRSMFGIR